jgi:phosphatidylserine/phosphatidylglycerophosphate/cardiolipin synthase-like enzyme
VEVHDPVVVEVLSRENVIPQTPWVDIGQWVLVCIDFGRMPWHDVAMGLQGDCVYDIAEHFVLRWNFIIALPVLYALEVHDPVVVEVLSRENVIPQTPWVDIAMGLQGDCVYDIAEHFVLRWNFIKRDKYKRSHDDVVPGHAAEVDFADFIALPVLYALEVHDPVVVEVDCVYDIAEHFVLRWNFIKRDKYKRSHDVDWLLMEHAQCPHYHEALTIGVSAGVGHSLRKGTWVAARRAGTSSSATNTSAATMLIGC